jgi:hypothetical protein
MDMMVKVHNRNKFEHREKFRGKEIVIPAGGYLSMDYDEANRFLGQMFSPKYDKGGVQTAQSYKWLEVDKEDRRKVELSLRNETEEKSKRVFVCMACGKEFQSKSALSSHAKEKHAEIMVKDEDEDGKD